jgi:hypothetical protein
MCLYTRNYTHCYTQHCVKVNYHFQALASQGMQVGIVMVAIADMAKIPFLLPGIESLSPCASLHYSDWAIQFRNVWFKKNTSICRILFPCADGGNVVTFWAGARDFSVLLKRPHQPRGSPRFCSMSIRNSSHWCKKTGAWSCPFTSILSRS